ncbi:hypothetical protein HCH54_005246 [Aspergillus fumigatus]
MIRYATDPAEEGYRPGGEFSCVFVGQLPCRVHPPSASSPRSRSRLILFKLEQSSLHSLSIPLHTFLDNLSRKRNGCGLSTSKRALSILKPSYRIDKTSFAA